MVIERRLGRIEVFDDLLKTVLHAQLGLLQRLQNHALDVTDLQFNNPLGE